MSKTWSCIKNYNKALKNAEQVWKMLIKNMKIIKGVYKKCWTWNLKLSNLYLKNVNQAFENDQI